MQAESIAAQAARFVFPSHSLGSSLTLRTAAGFAAGGCLAVALWSFWAQWGSALEVSCGLMLAAVTAFIGGLRAMQGRSPHRHYHAVVCGCLAAAVLSAPYLARGTLTALQWVSVSALESRFVIVVVAYCAAMICVGPTIVLLCLACARPPRHPRLRSRLADPCLWSGMSLCMVAIPLSSGLVLGMEQFGWLLAAGAAGVAGIEFWRAQCAAPDASQPRFDREERRNPWDLTDVGHLLSGVMIGVSAAVSLQMLSQLQAGMTFVVYASVAGILAGAAIGLALRSRRACGRAMEAENLLGAGMLLAVVSVTLLSIVFGMLVDLHLWLSATVSQVWILVPARALLAGLPLVPCGLAIVIATDERPHMVRGHFPGELSTVAAAAAIAFALYRACAVEPNVVLPWLELFACGLAALFLRMASLQADLGRRAVIATAVGIILAAAGLWFTDYDPARAARLLYSTNTFSAYRGGVSPDTLMVLDDGRLAALRSNGRSTWSVWKHHGAQLQFRENGVPRHITSVDLAVCPQSSAELLPAVMPLVLHPHPRDVLLTGLGSTATLQTCLAFPVTSVTCTEPDRALVSLATGMVAREIGGNVLDDSRVRMLDVDSALAAAAADRSYDVIIVAATQPALFSSVSTATTDYYARMARKLQPGGVLCQRFQYVDLGAGPVRDIAATLRTVFPQVRILETAPGEVLLLASNDDGPAIDPSLATRAQSAHVRRIMSQTGWDWSILLGLAAVDVDGVAAITDAARPNDAADGRNAFGLAPEVARWGAKTEEIQTLLGPHRSQMLAWIGPCTDAEEAAKRLADVTEQQKVIQANPEQFWAYRKALKERLQNRPRSVIVPVAHEGLQRRMHPEDERRKAYLLALGDSARLEHPDAASIQRVSSFVEPYDPLVSFFAHHEAAYLLSRSEQPDAAAELAHRLHTVYYGAGADQSVRNVTAALQLLLRDESTVSTAQDRWDHVNSLLEMLRHRWASRLPLADQSRYAAADVSESLSASQQALQVMDELASGLSVEREAWLARRAWLDTELIRPLKAAQVEQAERPRPLVRSSAAPVIR
ncbi:MAG: hypothetical protein JNG89_09490 [Planctomycetaceae bacterium]|nr:hypothetical protein [Planctomycetaceae bacterium]